MVKPSDILKKQYPVCKDPNAQTIKEIIDETGLSDNTIRRHARKMVELGKWKQVIKKNGGAYVKAYLVLK